MATRPEGRGERALGGCLGVGVVLAVVGPIGGALAVLALRAVWSSDEETARHPVVTSVSDALAVAVLLALALVGAWLTGRELWRRWTRRLRGGHSAEADRSLGSVVNAVFVDAVFLTLLLGAVSALIFWTGWLAQHL